MVGEQGAIDTVIKWFLVFNKAVVLYAAYKVTFLIHRVQIKRLFTGKTLKYI